MRPVELHPAALDETSEAVLYYRRIDEKLSRRFQSEVFAAIEKTRLQPLIYRCFDQDFRKVRVPRFPYAVVFRLLGADTIQVVAVMHMHREPDYWRNRID